MSVWGEIVSETMGTEELAARRVDCHEWSVACRLGSSTAQVAVSGLDGRKVNASPCIQSTNVRPSGLPPVNLCWQWGRVSDASCSRPAKTPTEWPVVDRWGANVTLLGAIQITQVIERQCANNSRGYDGSVAHGAVNQARGGLLFAVVRRELFVGRKPCSPVY